MMKTDRVAVLYRISEIPEAAVRTVRTLLPVRKRYPEAEGLPSTDKSKSEIKSLLCPEIQNLPRPESQTHLHALGDGTQRMRR